MGLLKFFNSGDVEKLDIVGVFQMDGGGQRDHEHVSRELRQGRHQAGAGGLQVQRGHRGQGTQAEREVSHIIMYVGTGTVW